MQARHIDRRRTRARVEHIHHHDMIPELSIGQDGPTTIRHFSPDLAHQQLGLTRRGTHGHVLSQEQFDTSDRGNWAPSTAGGLIDCGVDPDCERQLLAPVDERAWEDQVKWHLLCKHARNLFHLQEGGNSSGCGALGYSGSRSRGLSERRRWIIVPRQQRIGHPQRFGHDNVLGVLASEFGLERKADERKLVQERRWDRGLYAETKRKLVCASFSLVAKEKRVSGFELEGLFIIQIAARVGHSALE